MASGDDSITARTRALRCSSVSRPARSSSRSWCSRSENCPRRNSTIATATVAKNTCSTPSGTRPSGSAGRCTSWDTETFTAVAASATARRIFSGVPRTYGSARATTTSGPASTTGPASAERVPGTVSTSSPSAQMKMARATSPVRSKSSAATVHAAPPPSTTDAGESRGWLINSPSSSTPRPTARAVNPRRTRRSSSAPRADCALTFFPAVTAASCTARFEVPTMTPSPRACQPQPSRTDQRAVNLDPRCCSLKARRRPCTEWSAQLPAAARRRKRTAPRCGAVPRTTPCCPCWWAARRRRRPAR